MNIVAFSINPLFPDRVMGGAPKHLQNIAVQLGEQGHHVTVLSTMPDQNAAPFQWHDNVLVRPVLPFKQPFPQPYDVPAYRLAEIVQRVGDALRDADRFYMHDGEFLFPYAYRDVPTVISLRDSVYPETQLGGFLFQGDTLITISEHSRQYYLQTAGRFFPGLAERTVVIHNGLDWDVFRPTPPDDLLRLLPVDPASHAIVLHPHRPEPSKGLPQTIEVADLLVHQYGLDQLRVLTPRWLETGQGREVREFQEAMEQEIARRGLERNFVFHDWIPQELMPQYYSLGHVTVSLGHFVESFGNAVYESLGCGTPSIAARVATHRELLPDGLLDKVHFGDVAAAAEIAAEIITTGRRTAPETLAYLQAHYSRDRQLAAYAAAIEGATVAEPLTYRLPALDDQTLWRLAPWCYLWAGGIYHDYLAEHRPMAALSTLHTRDATGFFQEDAAELGVRPDELAAWFHAGYIVPVV